MFLKMGFHLGVFVLIYSWCSFVVSSRIIVVYLMISFCNLMSLNFEVAFWGIFSSDFVQLSLLNILYHGACEYQLKVEKLFWKRKHKPLKGNVVCIANEAQQMKSVCCTGVRVIASIRDF